MSVSGYPNHYLFKKRRLVVLEQCKYLCVCGRPAQHVHHMNHDKADHRIENLKALCVKCHVREHSHAHAIGVKVRVKEVRFIAGHLGISLEAARHRQLTLAKFWFGCTTAEEFATRQATAAQILPGLGIPLTDPFFSRHEN